MAAHRKRSTVSAAVPCRVTRYAQRLEVSTGGTYPDQTYTIGDTILGQNDGGTLSVFMTDGEDSTRQLTAYTSSGTTNGHVVGRYDFKAFGDNVTFTVSTHAANTAGYATLICSKASRSI